jgi:diacylglycerol O-acyltransferase / wax synthase
MIHLSGVDASFLHLETPEMPMHVGSLHVLDLPEGYKGDFYEDVVKHVGNRLHLASVFERKLAQMPFEMSNPVWVDDDDVDLEYHIRRVVLSKPGSFRQLEQYVGRLHSTLLDRSRPLWEMFVIEGLHTGQVGLYAKVHHAAIDGQAGVALAKALYDITAEPRTIRPPRQRSRANQYQLGVAELATAAAQNTLQQYIKLITTIPNAVRAMATVAMPAMGQIARLPMTMMPNLLQPGMGLLSLDNLAKLPATIEGGLGLPTSLGFGPRTPLNVSITNQRSFAGRTVSLAETKAVGRRAGVSLNDVVMAACASALRRYMKELGITLDKAMTAAVPVSLREAGNEDPNNQVTLMLATLATDIKDPLQRLRAIHASTTSSKELTGNIKAAIPTDFPSFGAPWIMTGLATLFGRSKITDQIPPLANVAISNVPGVPVPLYVAGARMATYFPVSIPAHGCALNITVQSYNGQLDYGLTACRRALPDADVLADYIVEAHDELKKAVEVLPLPAPRPDKANTVAAAMPAPAPVAAAVPAPQPAPIAAQAVTPTPAHAQALLSPPAQVAQPALRRARGNGSGKAASKSQSNGIAASPVAKSSKAKKNSTAIRATAAKTAKRAPKLNGAAGKQPPAKQPAVVAARAKTAATKRKPARTKRNGAAIPDA